MDIPWTLVGDIGPTALLSAAVLMILTGHLVPKSTFTAEQKRGDAWRETAMKKQEIIQTQAETIRDQSVVSETVVKVMTSVQEAAKAGESR